MLVVGVGLNREDIKRESTAPLGIFYLFAKYPDTVFEAMNVLPPE